MMSDPIVGADASCSGSSMNFALALLLACSTACATAPAPRPTRADFELAVGDVQRALSPAEGESRLARAIDLGTRCDCALRDELIVLRFQHRAMLELIAPNRVGAAFEAELTLRMPGSADYDPVLVEQASHVIGYLDEQGLDADAKAVLARLESHIDEAVRRDGVHALTTLRRRAALTAVLGRSGRLDQALRHARTARKGLEALPREFVAERLEVARLLGDLLQMAGDYEQAIELHELAFATGAGRPELATRRLGALIGMRSCYDALLKSDDARDRFDRGLATLRPELHEAAAELLAALLESASRAISHGDASAALAAATEGAALAKRFRPEASPDWIGAMTTLASAQRLALQRDASVESAQLAANAADTLLTGSRSDPTGVTAHVVALPAWIRAQSELAAALDASGRLSEAETVYRTEYDVLRSFLGPKDLALLDPLERTITLLRRSGRTAEAESLLQAAEEIAEAATRQAVLAMPSLQASQALEHLRQLLSHRIASALANPNAISARSALEALWRVQSRDRQRARLLRARLARDVEPALTKVRDAWAEVQLERAGLLIPSGDAGTQRARLRTLRLRAAQLERRLTRAVVKPDAEELARVTMDEVVASLDGETLLIGFAVFWDEARAEFRDAMWALDHKGTPRWWGLGPSLPNLPIVARLGVTLAAGKTGLERATAGCELFDTTLARLGDLSAYRRLLVLPDGPFALLPLAAMPMPTAGGKCDPRAPGPFLVEHLEVGFLATISDLRRRDLAAQPSPPLIVGAGLGASAQLQTLRTALGPATTITSAIDFSKTSFAPLPGVGTEVDAVAQYLNVPGLERLEGADASEASLRRKVRGPSILHIASHGYMSYPARQTTSGSANLVADEPLLASGLVLTRGARDAKGAAHIADDGYMTALELGLLDLVGTRLVVLSACESKRGQVTLGESSPFGAEQAVLDAGAESVVASLWQVDDFGTACLMDAFYRHLVDDHLAPAAALREAQLDLLRGRSTQPGCADRKLAAPSYWAAFALTGGGRAIVVDAPGAP